ncbi:UNVERIFIED_CONTAM: lytic transglycosylase, partial [Salmonella enterica subsp. enterica serovar Weltevreden]
TPLAFEIVETKHYVPYETLRQLCGADDELFRKLNPAYRPEVMEGKLYVPPGHLIRVPAGSAKSFDVAYARLGEGQRFSTQRVSYLLHKVKR